MVDAFENAVKIKGHKTIKASKESWQLKMQMLKCLYIIQNKSLFYYILRDFSVWKYALWIQLGKVIKINPLQIQTKDGSIKNMKVITNE